eukprot:1292377-Rhodomonas_salina.1
MEGKKQRRGEAREGRAGAPRKQGRGKGLSPWCSLPHSVCRQSSEKQGGMWGCGREVQGECWFVSWWCSSTIVAAGGQVPFPDEAEQPPGPGPQLELFDRDRGPGAVATRRGVAGSWEEGEQPEKDRRRRLERSQWQDSEGEREESDWGEAGGQGEN